MRQFLVLRLWPLDCVSTLIQKDGIVVDFVVMADEAKLGNVCREEFEDNAMIIIDAKAPNAESLRWSFSVCKAGKKGFCLKSSVRFAALRWIRFASDFKSLSKVLVVTICIIRP